jgi:uncharacterized membrane protein YraQ (UPF0718 family)
MGLLQSKKLKSTFHIWILPAIVILLYIIFFIINPEKTVQGLVNTGNTLYNMLAPLLIVFLIMLLINIFLKPSYIVKFLGKDAGFKGIALSIALGIISTGPIYTWYPLLKDLKDKGADYKTIAIFLHNRSIKPFLLPIMIAYFGLIYIVILTVLTIICSVGMGYIISSLMKDDHS